MKYFILVNKLILTKYNDNRFKKNNNQISFYQIKIFH